MRSRRFLVLGFLLTMLLAGVGSFYASSNPDGLERVAERLGFADQATEPATADGPFADYQVKGIDDNRLSGGLAGVAGTAVVLIAAGGLFWGLRRRPPAKER